jgi:hypothetical protein
MSHTPTDVPRLHRLGTRCTNVRRAPHVAGHTQSKRSRHAASLHHPQRAEPKRSPADWRARLLAHVLGAQMAAGEAAHASAHRLPHYVRRALQTTAAVLVLCLINVFSPESALGGVSYSVVGALAARRAGRLRVTDGAPRRSSSTCLCGSEWAAPRWCAAAPLDPLHWLSDAPARCPRTRLRWCGRRFWAPVLRRCARRSARCALVPQL